MFTEGRHGSIVIRQLEIPPCCKLKGGFTLSWRCGNTIISRTCISWEQDGPLSAALHNYYIGSKCMGAKLMHAICNGDAPSKRELSVLYAVVCIPSTTQSCDLIFPHALARSNGLPSPVLVDPGMLTLYTHRVRSFNLVLYLIPIY